MMARRQPMPEPRRLHRKANADEAVYAAEDYLNSIMAEEENFSREEIEAVRDSVESVRRGEMTLAEFEEKYGL
jgi:hypothetical protein